MTVPFDLWGQRGYPATDIVGESHYYAPIRALLGDDFRPEGAEISATALLMPEPTNRHDRNAVAVRIDGNVVGYLPRDEAARYTGVLTGLVARGWLPQVAARVWGAEWNDYDEGVPAFRGSVRLDLAEPHLLVPANLAPTVAHRLLPRGNAIQVTGEENHLAELSSFLRPEGECWAYATLHEIVEQATRTSRSLVEVRLDGNRVGQLTPKMSGEILPAMRHLADQGRATAVRALVKGNRIKVEVVLYTVRAHELPESWLESPAAVLPTVPEISVPVVPARPRRHAPIPPPPIGVRFVVPAVWPQPPVGWRPPPGWSPDPSWEPAPEDWQWWVPVWA